MVMRFIVLLLLLAGCSVVETGPEPAVYFCPRDDCEGVFVNLSMASDNVICAFYDLDLPDMIEAMSDARLVLDNKGYYDNEELLHGLDIKVARKNHQMHNKFCVFDDIVVTGSFNPTYRGRDVNNNNVIVIKSESLADNYRKEFEELRSGVYSGGRKSSLSMQFNDAYIENYFCPEDCSPSIFTDLIDSADSSVHFMTFSFTHDDIGDALMAAHDRGVYVTGVFEKTQQNKWNEFERLGDAGIDVRWDSNKANMHHKVFVIDEEVVITGSTNPSKNGLERNDENVLIIHDKSIAVQFLHEYQNLNK